jgi:hypothetical protein
MPTKKLAERKGHAGTCNSALDLECVLYRGLGSKKDLALRVETSLSVQYDEFPFNSELR